jgi:hypothetical protein
MKNLRHISLSLVIICGLEFTVNVYSQYQCMYFRNNHYKIRLKEIRNKAFILPRKHLNRK